MTNFSIPLEITSSLEALAKCNLTDGIKPLFSSNENRVEQFSYEHGGLYLDFSKTHISEKFVSIYERYAQAVNFKKKRHALFSGVRINQSEDRAVLHTLLRDSENQGISLEDKNIGAESLQAKQQLIDSYHSINQSLKERQKPIKSIIHVGIGGSSLGTQLLLEALSSLNDEIKVHFIGNIDAHQLVNILSQCHVDSTLVIGVSKTFSTAETIKNLESIGKWFTSRGNGNYLDSYYAVTANQPNAVEFGILSENIVSFPAWVGGRYSVWSSVSLSAILVLGIDRFEEFLDGASEMDQYFYQTDVAENVCYLSAALDHYYANYLSVKSRAVFAYDYRLRSLTNYLQQLETESNGKDRQLDGSPVDQQTSMVVWGGVGTDVQHSVFQMLHQGTSMILAEFVLVKEPDHQYDDHHTELLANGVAQTAALLAGQDMDDVEQRHAGENLTELTKQAKLFSGDRPSITILLDRLTPKLLGSLLAFYEHRTFCGGVLSNINSFDQMGVELGKHLAKQVKPLLESASRSNDSPLDTSTQNLISRLKK